jgi:hypothetical protein
MGQGDALLLRRLSVWQWSALQHRAIVHDQYSGATLVMHLNLAQKKVGDSTGLDIHYFKFIYPSNVPY